MIPPLPENYYKEQKMLFFLLHARIAKDNLDLSTERKRKEVNMDVRNFGPTVKAVRKAMGMTQRDLAESTGLTAAAICAYEKGERYPNFPAAVKVADALGLSLDEMVKGEPVDVKVTVGKES